MEKRNTGTSQTKPQPDPDFKTPIDLDNITINGKPSGILEEILQHSGKASMSELLRTALTICYGLTSPRVLKAEVHITYRNNPNETAVVNREIWFPDCATSAQDDFPKICFRKSDRK